MIVVSACLVGVNCRYSGGSNDHQGVIDYLKDRQWVPVCPEQLGGLMTPRFPAEIESGEGEDVLKGMGKVKTKDGEDVTKAFVKGAEETLKITKLVGAKEAILKEGSPSCGSCMIYDGTFQHQRKSGSGVTTALLRKYGILVKSEVDFDQKT